MQRAQRALDNPALDLAVEVANVLRQPVVIFFAPVPFYPHANLRHYAFLAQGIPDIAERARKRGIGFVLRTLSRAFAAEVLRRGEGVDRDRRRKPDARAPTLARIGREETQRAAVDRRCRRDRPFEVAGERAVRRPHHPPAPAATPRAIPAPAPEIRVPKSNGKRLAASRLCPTTAPSTSPKDGRTSTAPCSRSTLFAEAPAKPCACSTSS